MKRRRFIIVLAYILFASLLVGCKPSQPPDPSDPAARLKILDAKIAPAAKKAKMVQRRLSRSKREEASVRQAVSDVISKLPASDRDSFKQALEKGRLLDDEDADPIKIAAFEKLREIASLRSQNEVLGATFMRYKTELIRARSERDRLRRRLKTKHALGFDPENSDGEVDYGVLDELAAYNVETILEKKFPTPLEKECDITALFDDLVAAGSNQEAGSKNSGNDGSFDALVDELAASPLKRIFQPHIWGVVALLMLSWFLGPHWKIVFFASRIFVIGLVVIFLTGIGMCLYTEKFLDEKAVSSTEVAEANAISLTETVEEGTTPAPDASDDNSTIPGERSDETVAEAETASRETNTAAVGIPAVIERF